MLIVATPFNLKPTDTTRSASYLDLHLEIDNAIRERTKPYDKGYNFTEYPSGAPEFIPVFSGVSVTQSLVLCVHVVFCRSLFVCFSPL